MKTTVRRAEKSDMPAVARLAARLVRMHHTLDPQRFLLQEPVEPGYEWWLTRELENEKAVILVAEDEAPGGGAGRIIGYAYGRLEPRDWNALLDAFGALHDVYVDEEVRSRGVGSALVAAIAKDLEGRGAPRLVLSTATPNTAAQALFRKMGFRPTMIEMTRELGGGSGRPG